MDIYSQILCHYLYIYYTYRYTLSSYFMLRYQHVYCQNTYQYTCLYTCQDTYNYPTVQHTINISISSLTEHNNTNHIRHLLWYIESPEHTTHNTTLMHQNTTHSWQYHTLSVTNTILISSQSPLHTTTKIHISYEW